MKKALLILVGVAVILLQAVGSYAVAPTGLKSSGLLDSNAHSHVTTTTCKIYTIVVTPTANSGFAQIIDTNGLVDSAVTGLGAGEDGLRFVSGKESRVKADIQGATAGNTVQVNFEDGVNCDKLFVDANGANVEVYYRE